MNSIKKQRKGSQYNKNLTKEEKSVIMSQLNKKSKKISEIAKEYNLPRSTVFSYSKSKEPIYSQFLSAVLTRAQEWVDKNFEILNSLKNELQVKKYITNYLQNERVFENSSVNPLHHLIPQTKLESKKQRIFQKVVKEILEIFKNKNVVKKDESKEQYYEKDYFNEQNIFEESIFISSQEEFHQNIQTQCQDKTEVVEQYEPFKAFDYDSQSQYFY
ncbi:unnamed protein product (macronuclear) [Paramecium tetraurelia]|uniref:HTH psq-type domain-containing protein n=1 Tax=Paramecium tetraurelia TaxID=5888 RepID=A0C721_PARTE|nr:uncharacterized protein GSPATT00035718001 [Paramecium tetraurelia]CAK66588.1 unnamed protein product [Paramecium tetraurelia]|eukprot:XP_001433985.1 hypothetical protein (macronuclear) [Paramecium tetraurelia strain d4-2]